MRGIGYFIRRGEVLGLAGESGCGKTTSSRALLGLLPTASVAGSLAFPPGDRVDLADQRPRSPALGPLRGRRIALASQEPTAALDPLRRIGVQVQEVVEARRRLSPRASASAAVDLLRRVGLEAAEVAARAYPHELSGGMRQRAALALTLACRPDVLVADEPTTALDSVLQMRVLEALLDAGLAEAGALELITHDLAVLRSFADRIAVMYAGRIVETAATQELIEHPAHPYVRQLVAATPTLAGPARRLADRRRADGEPWGGSGCAFAPRCPRVAPTCGQDPPVVEVGVDHWMECWRAEESQP